MILIDTHTHLYLDAFNDDRDEVIHNAIANDVKILLLPNIDSKHAENMLNLCERFPANCFPMMGLHPGSVKMDFLKELEHVESNLKKGHFIAIGETGMDFYWDKTYKKEQELAFRKQLDLAGTYELPIVIHSREAIDELIDILNESPNKGITGVFHCFTGTHEQAEKIINLGFRLGIGGVLTFKNSGLKEVVRDIDLKHIILETDAPFLAPVPYRGKRNESAYIRLVAEKL
ncbi:TatD family hydrolase, partial [candidate division KSB1 bacterium]